METIGSRIRKLREDLGLKRPAIAKVLGVSPAAIAHWEEDTNAINSHNLIQLAHFFNCSSEFILYGKKTDEESQLRQTTKNINIQTEIRISKVPLISEVQAGTWNEAVDHYHTGDAAEWRETTSKVSHHAFALRVEGDSMTNPYGSPSIPEGSIIIVDPQIEATSGKIVVAKLTDTNQVTLKKLVIDGPHTYLKPLNPEHSLIKVNDNCVIVGVVTQVVQDL